MATPPLDLAQGRADSSLVALNGALAGFGRLVYVRPMPEMNGHWNEYCAFNKDGSSRGPRYSTASFRKAFARIAIFARGGSRASMSAQLRKLGLPGVASDLPLTQARVVWNPQGYGAPDLPANSAAAYYPGDAYVDVVANDIYRQSTGAAWDANEALYRRIPAQALRDRRVGPLGNGRPRVRRADGRLHADPLADGVPLVLQQQAGIALGSRFEAAEPRQPTAG